MIKEITNKQEKQTISSTVLLDLPEWFGIEEYTKEYIDNSMNYPFFAAYQEDSIVGFLSLKETSEYTVEIYCMGVLKDHHNKGFGKQLFEYAEAYANNKQYQLMQVKTVKQGVYDIYDKTNAFYKKLGFLELEVFQKLWDEWNPCQVFVKPIQ
jgi:GNAT superfamily N-acetyltransferase